jgi:hypothetical protein
MEECLECGLALCLQGCAHPLYRSEREGVKRERKRGRERERKKENEKERVFFKGMTGALAPFSYLVN